MKHLSTHLRQAFVIATSLMAITTAAGKAEAQLYSPSSLTETREINDVLSESDIPTGVGGFARDYVIELVAGDQITIDVISEEFDTLVSLLSKDGTTLSENDDGPDGTTNSLLFARIADSGKYTVRVRSYAGQGTGAFYLKLARLREIED